MKLRHSAPALVGALLFCGSAFATPVGAGSFNLSGTAMGSSTGLNFYLSVPNDQLGVTVNPATGAFSGLSAGTQETVRNLTAGNGVIPGTNFNFQNWVQLSNGINLDATQIAINTSIPVCAGSAFDNPLAPQACRPNATSPVVLLQKGDQVGNPNGVTASLIINGFAHFAGDTDLTPFIGTLNAADSDFTTVSSLVTAYNANGGVPAVGYQASFTTSAVVPEPMTMAFLGLGLLAIGAFRKTRSDRA
jgi:PEP-CTERM motif